MHLINHEQVTLDLTNISKNIEHLEEDMKATDKISELEAALRGIVMLKDTYDLNVDDMVSGSHHNTGLNYNDLYLMAGMVNEKIWMKIFFSTRLLSSFQAVKMNWYDTSIKLLRDAKYKEHSSQDKDIQVFPNYDNENP